MENDKRSFVHDTIDLDEIRVLLGDETEELIEDIENVEITDEIPQELDVSDIESTDDFSEEAFDSAEDAEEITIESSLEETSEQSAETREHEPTRKKKAGFLFELYSMLHDVIYLLAAVTLIFVFVVRLVGVQGDSMLPTLHNRDYLVLESNFISGDSLEYGDVVVLNVPHYQHNGEGPIVKRVIATEGQTVDIDFETGVVYVDGVRLVEDYVNAPTLYNWEGEFAMEYPATVPEGCIFVLGDNRNNSMDSRYAPIGMVDEQYVLGKVLLIVLPGQTTDEAGNAMEPRDWGRMGLVS